MARVKALLLGCIALVSTGGTGEANGSQHRPAERAPSYMRVYGQTPPPYGFIQFCEMFPAECKPGPAGDEKRFAADAERLSELDEVNRYVNRTIQPASDLELYGITEWWTIPVDKGDCEDYALLKRQILIKRGWPVGSLLMTVVRDEKGEGHAVLTARTVQGDFILDNKIDEIKSFEQTPYRLVMRQSYLHPRVWMSLDPKDAPSPAAMAGVKRSK